MELWGFARFETIHQSDGIVDIYMPDGMWADDEAAAQYSKAPRYWEAIADSLQEWIVRLAIWRSIRMASPSVASSSAI